jgi:hypothetical protein
VSWSRRFEEPIVLPDGRKLKTLAEAMACLTPEVLQHSFCRRFIRPGFLFHLRSWRLR